MKSHPVSEGQLSSLQCKTCVEIHKRRPCFELQKMKMMSPNSIGMIECRPKLLVILNMVVFKVRQRNLVVLMCTCLVSNRIIINTLRALFDD